jgi:hypothetical protein
LARERQQRRGGSGRKKYSDIDEDFSYGANAYADFYGGRHR